MHWYDMWRQIGSGMHGRRFVAGLHPIFFLPIQTTSHSRHSTWFLGIHRSQTSEPPSCFVPRRDRESCRRLVTSRASRPPPPLHASRRRKLTSLQSLPENSSSNRGPCSLPPPRRLCARARRRPIDCRRPVQASPSLFSGRLPLLLPLTSLSPAMFRVPHGRRIWVPRRRPARFRPPLPLPRPDQVDPASSSPPPSASSSCSIPASGTRR